MIKKTNNFISLLSYVIVFGGLYAYEFYRNNRICICITPRELDDNKQGTKKKSEPFFHFKNEIKK